MFKRKAHIVFFSRTQPELAETAVQLLANQDSAACEAHSANCEATLAALAHWADTVIFINDTALATAATSKIWSVTTPAELNARIAGLIGGLKLLRRMDQD